GTVAGVVTAASALVGGWQPQRGEAGGRQVWCALGEAPPVGAVAGRVPVEVLKHDAVGVTHRWQYGRSVLGARRSRTGDGVGAVRRWRCCRGLTGRYRSANLPEVRPGYRGPF